MGALTRPYAAPSVLHIAVLLAQAGAQTDSNPKKTDQNPLISSPRPCPPSPDQQRLSRLHTLRLSMLAGGPSAEDPLGNRCPGGKGALLILAQGATQQT